MCRKGSLREPVASPNCTEEDVGLGLEEKEEVQQEVAVEVDSMYSKMCKYMLPLTCQEFADWDAEWVRANMGRTYLRKKRAAGLSRMCFSPWCCVFVTFMDQTTLDEMNGSVTLDIITRADSLNMRHGFRTARSAVYWLFRNTSVAACNLDTSDSGGSLWWRLHGVVCIVGRVARGSGTFTLLPLPGPDSYDNPDTDDEASTGTSSEEMAEMHLNMKEAQTNLGIVQAPGPAAGVAPDPGCGYWTLPVGFRPRDRYDCSSPTRTRLAVQDQCHPELES